MQSHARVSGALLDTADERDLIFELQPEGDVFDCLAFRALGVGGSGCAEGGEADEGGRAKCRRSRVRFPIFIDSS
jgi:hypothetical protein